MTDEEQKVDPQQEFENFFKLEHYRERLASLSIEGKTSLSVSFEELVSYNRQLAEALIDKPNEFLTYAKNGAYSQLQIEDPEYAEKIKDVTVRLYDLFETTPLRKIGSEKINKLIMINGVVVKSTIVKPKVLKAAFECRRCGERQFIEQTQHFLRVPVVCINQSCQSKGPFEYVEEESEYVNIQELWIQENPEQLPPGQLPRSLQLKLTGEIVDAARPGDNVSVVGIVKSLPKKVKGGQLSIFDLFVEVNSIEVLGKEPEAIPDISEINRILELGKDPWIHRKILQSIAPSIYGYENVKEAIMYLLFGGVPKELEDIKIRGDINCLLIGDPGTGKSQLLRYVARLAPRGLYTSGKGTSAVGLTAAVLKDEAGQYSLEAGALVLADKGVACIDELEKMTPTDRVAIHEALEQGSVSVAKAGIVATLNARTAVLAAANPSLGRYNAFASIIENINLPVTLLSRFDLIFLMRDVPEPTHDTNLSKHVLAIHSGIAANPPIPPDLLRKYITYAKQLQPKLTTEAIARIQGFYLKMRKASGETAEGSPITVGPRQLEGLARIAEARARAALREEVTAEDAEAAISIMMRSLEEVGIDLSSGKIDIDIIMTGKPKSTRDKLATILKLIIDLEKETGQVEETYLLDELEKTYSIPRENARALISQLLREGTIFEPRDGFLKKT